MSTATVVGGGPNGLAAAVAARQQRASRSPCSRRPTTIGGGTRTGELAGTRPAARPLLGLPPDGGRLAVPEQLGLDRYGLPGGGPRSTARTRSTADDAGLLYRSVEDTAAGLDADGARWRRRSAVPRPSTTSWRRTSCGRCCAAPRHPLALARFGLPTLLPALGVRPPVRHRDKARALFGGVAAHAFRPLHRPLTSAIGAGIITAGHR